MRLPLFTLAATALAVPAFADELNIYSYRQPELIQPLLDAFTAETGIATNVAYVDKGLVERLKAEGRRSPADIILTVDISRLTDAKGAGVTQGVDSETLNSSIPASVRDPESHWFALTTRARIIYASKDRVGPGEITTYEDLADPNGRVASAPGRERMYTRLAFSAPSLNTTVQMLPKAGLKASKPISPRTQKATTALRSNRSGRANAISRLATPTTWEPCLQTPNRLNGRTLCASNFQLLPITAKATSTSRASP